MSKEVVKYKNDLKFNSADEFRLKLDVPDSYANRRLMEKIIRPAIAEIQNLDNLFRNFKCEPRYLCKRGRPLAGYKFTWKPENTKNHPDQSYMHGEQKSSSKNSANGFDNFHQRTYDYEEFEKELLTQLSHKNFSLKPL